MKIFCTALLLFICTTAFARNNYYDYFNTDAFWQKLVQDDDALKPIFLKDDTVIAVASNRKLMPGNLRFISEERAEGPAHYYLVYTQGGRWHLLAKSSLAAMIAMMPHPNSDWVVYTEGMGKIFTTDIDRGLSLAGLYRINVLLLDYPSIHTGYSSLKNYHFAYNNARLAYKDFVPVLDTFKRLRAAEAAGSGHLTLFFHSMGNNLMRKIAQQNLLFMFNTHTMPWVDDLVLNAPCVPRRGSKKWVEKITFAKRIYVHYNSQDGTLKWARLAGFRQIMGEHTKHPAGNAVYINFNTLAGRSHSNFLSIPGRTVLRPEAYEHYNAIFHGSAVDVNDAKKYRVSTWRGVGWDILP